MTPVYAEVDLMPGLINSVICTQVLPQAAMMDCNIVFVSSESISSGALQIFTLLYKVLDFEQAAPMRVSAGCQQRRD
jgi:hypothetical protein